MVGIDSIELKTIASITVSDSRRDTQNNSIFGQTNGISKLKLTI